MELKDNVGMAILEATLPFISATELARASHLATMHANDSLSLSRRDNCWASENSFGANWKEASAKGQALSKVIDAKTGYAFPNPLKPGPRED